jgi:hypothetical protein
MKKRFWVLTIVAIAMFASVASRNGMTTPTAASNSQVAASAQTDVTSSSSETISQANARKSASSYLAMSAFSSSGLIKQLEFEGYSTEDATYGVDAQNANWDDQAAKSGKSYLDMSAFSRSGLISQLEYEGFTQSQAEYGASANGL